MVDLTKFYGEQGYVLKPSVDNYFDREERDESDLINEMREHGLDVNFLEKTGEIIRCRVLETGASRADKANEKSGYYSFYEMSNCFICVYGNWRDQTQYKFSSNSYKELSANDKADFQKEIEERTKAAEAERKERNQRAALECQEVFRKSNNFNEHSYLDAKGLNNNYGLTELNGSLLVPLYSTTNQDKVISSIQYITKKNNEFQKKFAYGAETKGAIWTVGFDWSEWGKLDEICVAEGMATAASIFSATKIPTISVMSANFGLQALTNIRKWTSAKIYICYDNDANGVGYKKAKEIQATISDVYIRLPSIEGDFNDLHCQSGLDAVKNEIIQKGFALRTHSAKSFVGEPPEREWLVERILELGKPTLLSAIGGVGKSFSILDLCMKINQGSGNFLGNKINVAGNCMVVSSEDDLSELHRRTHILDGDGKRFDTPYDTYFLSVADFGKPINLVANTGAAGVSLTEQATELVDSLSEIPDLKLVVLDPIQSFVTADLNDNSVGQIYSQLMSQIATRFSCSVISIHHLNKGALNVVDSMLAARSQIRGSSSLVDSHRNCIVYYLPTEEDCEKICAEHNVEYDRLKVVRAAVVKSNGEADMKIKTLIRNGAFLELVEDVKFNIQWD